MTYPFISQTKLEAEHGEFMLHVFENSDKQEQVIIKSHWRSMPTLEDVAGNDFNDLLEHTVADGTNARTNADRPIVLTH